MFQIFIVGFLADCEYSLVGLELNNDDLDPLREVQESNSGFLSPTHVVCPEPGHIFFPACWNLTCRLADPGDVITSLQLF